MSDGFVEFSMGDGDDKIGKKAKRFKGEAGRSYRVSLVHFNNYGDDGLPTADAAVAYKGCDRVYVKGVGNILADTPAMAEFGPVKQMVGTVICVWPTDKDGELDASSYKAGKGWQVQPFIFDPEKYIIIKGVNKKFSLRKNDLAIVCTDTTFQKMTFSPDDGCLLSKYLESGKPEFVSVAKKIIEEAKVVASTTLLSELARKMTPAQVREALGASSESPASGGGHTSKDVDDLLSDVI